MTNKAEEFDKFISTLNREQITMLNNCFMDITAADYYEMRVKLLEYQQ